MCVTRIAACSCVFVFLAGCAEPQTTAPEQSVKPGINKPFKDGVNVQKFVGIFEADRREIYKHREKIVETLGLKPGVAAADIGAGTGFYSILMAERVGPSGKVYAVDIAPRFLDRIQTLATAAKLTNISTVQCREDSVELPPNSIDLAFICDTYHHFEFPRGTMSSLHRALRPGGEVVIVEFLHDEENIAHLSEQRRDWLRDHVRLGRSETIAEVEGFGFAFASSPETPYLEESYIVRFCKVE